MTRGSYQLVLRLDRKLRIKIGKKGEYDFPPGYYIYTGSALNGLEGRIRRHLSRRKKNFWHIDYLLPHCRILSIIPYSKNRSNRLTECRLNARLLKKKNSQVVVKGFGSSDCMCPSHLVYFKKKGFETD